jgi:hypothetical protein
MLHAFAYGTEYHCVRVGFTGQRPLVYAVYAYNLESELPGVPGQTYRTITLSQYCWLLNHLRCDVSYINGEWAGREGNLECRTHNEHYKFFTDDPLHFDLWEERQI